MSGSVTPLFLMPSFSEEGEIYQCSCCSPLHLPYFTDY